MISLIKNIFNFLLSIGKFLTAPVRFLFHLFRDIVIIGRLMASAFETIKSYLSFIPAPVYAIILLMISIAIFYKLVGREG